MHAIHERMIQLLRSVPLDLSSEKRAQADLAIALGDAGICFEREVRLSDSDIADFLIEGLVVELKLRGRKKAIYRQLCRYAQHAQVKAILLASNQSMGLPAEIKGKDVYFVSLGESWL